MHDSMSRIARIRRGLAGAQGWQPSRVWYSGPGIVIPAQFCGASFNGPVISPSYSVSSVNTGADTITLNGSNNGRLWRCDRVRFTGSVAPGGLALSTEYVVLNKTPTTNGGLDAVTFQVATLAAPTTPIDLTSSGTSVTATLLVSDGGLDIPVGRGLDSGAPTWKSIHTAAGVFDWSAMDVYMDYHYNQRGRRLLYTIYQCPTWLAANAAVDNYGHPGGSSPPSDYAHVEAFGAALTARYNTVSAFNPSGAKMIWGVEGRNEPSHAGVGTPNKTYTGTTSQLAEEMRHLAIGVRSVDPTIKIVGPGYTVGAAMSGSASTSMYGFLAASDGAGGYGRDHIDMAAYHGYDMGDGSLLGLGTAVQIYRDRLVQAGLPANFPLAQTERGLVPGSHHNLHVRCWAIEAALGVQFSSAFQEFGPAPDFQSLAGADTLPAVNQFCAALGGTMTYCASCPGELVRAVIDGVEYWW